MADAPKLGLEQCTEIMKEHGGKMTTALSTLLLACQLQVANAQSVPRVVGPGEHRTDIIGAGELPKNVIVLPGGTATTEKGTWTVTASVSTSASAAADKGGQLVNIDGVEYTFAQIGGFPSEKQIQLLTQIKNPMQKIKLGGYLNEVANQKANEYTRKMEVANQHNKGKLQVEQAANQRKNREIVEEQAAIDKVTAQIPQVIPLYESDVQQGKKLSQEDKSRLEYVLGLGKPPEWMPRVKKLLSNPQNFA